MFDMDAFLDDELLLAMKGRPVVLFIEPQDPRIIETALWLPRFARPVFLGNADQVRDVLHQKLPNIHIAQKDFVLRESVFFDIQSNQQLSDELAQAALDLPPEQRIVCDIDEARRWVSTPAGFGITAALKGHCDFVVGGASHQPRSFFRHLLTALQSEPVVTEVGVIILPDNRPHDIFPENILFVGDVGVNRVMTSEILARVAVDTCIVARHLTPESLLPEIRGAMISYSNQGSDIGTSAETVREASQLVSLMLEEACLDNPRNRSISIQGEVKINVVLGTSSDRYTADGPRPEPDQRVNAIITPNLDTGNLLFHWLASRYHQARTFSVIEGIGYRGVNLPMNVSVRQAMLTVKANILRLHRLGKWTRTPHATFFTRPRILTINLGAAATKIAVFDGEERLYTDERVVSNHPHGDIENEPTEDQVSFRTSEVEKSLDEHGIALSSINAISVRGGLLHPVPHGTYRINDTMLRHFHENTYVHHPSNVGPLLAHNIAKQFNIPAFVVDPPVVDEMDNRCRYTGLKLFHRKPISYALSQIATARRYASENATFYENLNLIIAHMGIGISVGAHRKGKLVDTNNALDGEGPIAPTVSGSLPVGDLIRLCFSSNYTLDQLLKLNGGHGGLLSLLGTSDFRIVDEQYRAHDPKTTSAFEAVAYQISKSICSFVPAFDGEPIDQILISGGMAYSSHLVEQVRTACAPLKCGITIYPGDNESAALAQGALRVLEGREEAHTYSS